MTFQIAICKNEIKDELNTSQQLYESIVLTYSKAL